MKDKYNLQLPAKSNNDIAIVGMACHFPGAKDYNQFWQNLEQGVNSITEIPEERWSWKDFYSPLPQQPNKTISKWGGFIDDLDLFDAQFFLISPREANRMDPQQRLVLELSWRCLEDAGYSGLDLSGSPVGVFLGFSNYESILFLNKTQTTIDGHTGTGSWTNMISNRVSSYFNFSGPSLSLDTACSSSLVAVHQAIHALKMGECEQALVGGVNILCDPCFYLQFSSQGMLSPRGQCRTFDNGADGYVRGEGAGVILLKPLEKAIEDRDHIYGVIKGTAVNHGGKARTLTSPNFYAQTNVILAAYKKANIAPDTISYVEAHGTGTPLGDPIEINALKRAFRKQEKQEEATTQLNHYCGVGTVKTNVGHLEGASGIAGIIRVLLSLKHKKLTKLVNFEELNQRIKLNGSPFYLVLENQIWEQHKAPSGELIPRRAGISSFGIGGTNAHLILEEAPELEKTVQKTYLSPPPLQLLTLSAKTEKALEELVSSYHEHLQTHSESELADICYTAAIGRAHFNHRLSIIAPNTEELKEKLAQHQAKENVPGLISGNTSVISDSSKIVFLFTGQGSQYINMGRQLYETQPLFREVIQDCDRILRSELEHSLLSVLYPETEEEESLSAELINQTAYTQPALFAIEYALARLWQSWGIKPDAVMGHSVGEYVAATIAGIISLEDGLKLIANRGKLMQKLPSGGEMVVVMASEAQVKEVITACGDQVAIAAINGPENTVISGSQEQIKVICSELECSQIEGEEIKQKQLEVSHAFHSPLMEPILAEFAEIANQVTYKPSPIPLISNLTGEVINCSYGSSSGKIECVLEPEDMAEYWVKHIHQPVRFADSMKTLEQLGYEIFLEIGPKPILLGMGKRCIAEDKKVWLSSLRPIKEDLEQMLLSLGELYVKGWNIDWQAFYQETQAQKAVLPTYPFQRQRYWSETSHNHQEKQYLLQQKNTLHPLLGEKLELACLEKQSCFQSFIAEDSPTYLQHHRVFNKALFPTTAYLEMALATGVNQLKTEKLIVEDLVIEQGLILPAEKVTAVQTIVSPIEKEIYEFKILSKQKLENQDEPLWVLHAQGKIKPHGIDPSELNGDLQKYQANCNESLDIKEHYQQFHQQGIDYGHSFQGIQKLWKGANQAIGIIQLPQDIVEQASDYQLHPSLLDSALQVISHALPKNDHNQTYLPVGIDQLKVYDRPEKKMWAIASLNPSTESKEKTSEKWAVELNLVNEKGKIIAQIEGLKVKRTNDQVFSDTSSESINNCLYQIEWKPKVNFGQFLPSNYLLSPIEVQKQLNPVVKELTSNSDFDEYQEILSQLEKLSIEYICKAFQEIGWSYKPKDCFSLDSAVEKLNIVSSHRRLLQRIFEILTQEGILEKAQEHWQVTKNLENFNPEEKAEILLSQYPDASAELTLLHRCGSQLSQVLQGKVDPVQLVFPQGDLTTATQLYQDSPTAKVMNHLVQKAISKASEKLPQNRGIKLLEIGAGTGGTTNFILPHLNLDQTEYTFTDLGVLFTANAQKKFQAYPFVKYQNLDIETDPTSQGFTSHQYDIVIAANVLHATTDLTKTLSNVRKLLAPGGVLVLLEITTRQNWIDLIFGLLDGWWKFEDLELRPDYPLLIPKKWKQLLSQNGFPQVAIFPDNENSPEIVSQQALIVAQTDEKIPVEIELGSAPRESWLIMADKQGVAQELATKLSSRGQICTLVFTGEKYQQITSEKFIINPDSPEDFEKIMAQVAAQPNPLSGIVQCWTIETEVEPNINSEQLKALSKLGCGSTLFLLQALVKKQLSQAPRLWLVTQGAQPVPDSISGVSKVTQSSVWGMGKVIDLEYPELKCTQIDLDVNQTVEIKGAALFSEVGSQDKENQVAIRDDIRYVPRLISNNHQESALKQKQMIPSEPFRLSISQKGILDNLILEPITRSSPKKGEVEVRVWATGINFLDLALALGLVPQEVDGISQQHLRDTNTFGRECAGEIVAVGEEVENFKVGDQVIAMASGSFGQYVTVQSDFVVLKPENLNFSEAASIPVNFSTAYYALHNVAKISAGDRVLIHAGAGGTGMAAIQIAQLIGAEVFATASPPKWEILRKMGVKHIMNSRTLEFAEQIKEITQGQGVDVVLNSLTSGEFIPKTLSIVSPQGRFVEIAKRGVWESNRVAEVRPDISYYVVDLIREAEEKPELTQSILQQIIDNFAQDLFKVPPLKIFPVEESISAFRYMQQAKHIGKIVVAQTAEKTDNESQIPLTFSSEVIYLITGGLGGLGLLIANWMVERGAKHLVLVSRSAPKDVALNKLKNLKDLGANVIVEKGDVSDEQFMTGVVANINDSSIPLGGIIHSAGVLSDGVLQNQTWSSFEKVMSPKIQGAWNLHQLTKNQSLDFFILFSSAASLFGSPGQANHSAANAFLDGLAHYRQTMGLPGLSIHWGAVAQIGEAAERGADVRLQEKGMGAITPEQVIESLEILMKNGTTEVAVVPVDWSAWQERTKEWPFLENWQQTSSPTRKTVFSDSKSDQILEKLKGISELERKDILGAHLQKEIAQVLGLKISEIDQDLPLSSIGLDSLMAVELRNRIKTKLEVDIPITKIIEGVTITVLSTEINQQISQNDQTQFDDSLPTMVANPEQRYEPFALNEIQQAYWLGRNQAFDLGNIATHIYLELDCQNLNLERLNRALQKLIEHHDMLRMIVVDDAQQQILKPEQIPTYEIELLDLTGQSALTITQELEAIREQMSHEILPANQWPLFNIKATRFQETTMRLHISLDLLIADAWSIYLIFSQLASSYQNLASLLPKDEFSFRDYVVGELAIKETTQYRQSKDYWFNHLDSLPPAPEVPLAKPISAITKPRFKRRSAKLSRTDWQKLKQKAREMNLTPSGLLLTAFADILNSWSKTAKFTINLTLFNRLPVHPHVNQLVGDFTSLILLEVDNSEAVSFLKRAQKLQKQLWEDLDHNYVNAVEVQRELHRRGRRQPMGIVFTSTLGLSSLSGEEEIGEEFGLKSLGDLVYGTAQTPQVWLDHQVIEDQGALVLNWDAIEELFPETVLDEMFESYQNWLRQLATSDIIWKDTYSQIISPSLLTVQTEANQTDTSLSEETLHSLFIKQAKTASESTAIITSKKVLTYGELYQRAHQLGYELQQSGVKPNQLVAIVMEKGWEQIVAVLAILMSGAAYLPIDPQLPQERQLYLLQEAEVKQILTQSHLSESLSFPEEIQCWFVDIQETTSDLPALELRHTPEDLAYVIYTSGSTGLPKGVMIDHRGAVNTILDINQRFKVKSSDRVLAISALNFDLSVYDIFGVLGVGGTVVMPDPTGTKDPGHWIELMELHQVTLWNTVPALMQMLVEYLLGKSKQLSNYLRLVLLSGDWLPTNLPEKIRSFWSNAQVISLGGATEASIWSIIYPIEDVNPNWKSIPYGKPLLNQRFYVLDKSMAVCPKFVPGQLYIAGVGLALGYWKNEEKTKASFITHPVTQERLYKTGDLGRYLADGNIEFLGREDFQVKVNGYRVELGEIEVALKQNPHLKEAIVTAVGKSHQSKRLVAYIVVEQEGSQNQTVANEVNWLDLDLNSISQELRKYLKQKLPEYMVPSDYMILEVLPLNPNGKVDRKRLPEFTLNSSPSKTEYIPPQTDIEQKIAAIWREVLQIEMVGIHDNFYEIGGDSLYVIQVHAKLEQIFARELQVVDLFTYPTINSLGQYIAGKDGKDKTSKISKSIADKRLKKRSLRKKRAKNFPVS